MKTNKKVWLIVGICVFAIILALLFSNYSRQAEERERLENDLFTAQALLPKLTDQKEDLENQLAQAQSLLDRSRAKFPQSVESIEYGEDLFELADDYDLEVTKLTASIPTNKGAGSVAYSVSSFAVVVEGDMSDILDFIDALRAPDFQLPWSAEVTTAKLTYASEGDSATINVDIYAYKGE